MIVKFEEWANVMHVANVLTFPAHGSYTVAQWYMSLWQVVAPSVIAIFFKASKLSARILYPAPSVQRFESLSLVPPPQIPSKNRIKHTLHDYTCMRICISSWDDNLALDIHKNLQSSLDWNASFFGPCRYTPKANWATKNWNGCQISIFHVYNSILALKV